MRIGIVGLGRMGADMSARLSEHGHDVVGYDVAPDKGDVEDVAGLVRTLADEPRTVVWVMVPAGDPTTSTIEQLAELLGAGALVVDGGNSNFADSLEHAELLAEEGIAFVDVGVSGGVWGREQGYALMVGGDDADVADLEPVLMALAPPDGRGLAHVGEVGAGHYTKMVHNAVEYVMLQGIGEGYELLSAAELDLDVAAAMGSWRSGSVVRSWLLDLLVDELEQEPELPGVDGYVEDSGTGRWALQEAIDLAVPMPGLAAALHARFTSRQDDTPAMQAVATLRAAFGGHKIFAEDAS